MEEKTDLDLELVGHALEAACPGIRVDALRPLHRGYTSLQWVAETDEGALLIKVPQRDRDPAHLRRVVAATRLAAEAGVDVVRFRALLTSCPSMGGPVLVQEFVPGEPASSQWDSFNDRQRFEVCTALGVAAATIHSVSAGGFGDVLGRSRARSLAERVDQVVGELLPAAAGLAAQDNKLAGALRSFVDRLDPAGSVPALVHGDLWLPNVLLDADGKMSTLLDFEHASFEDRYAEFGKLDEHIFGTFPAGLDAFIAAYESVLPMPTDWMQRRELGQVIHALQMHVYFLQWTPTWAQQYANQVLAWLAVQP